MKKTIYNIYCLPLFTVIFLLLSLSIARAQTGCLASFNFQQASNSLTINFTDGSTSPNAISSWQWNFGDGSTSTLQNPSHTYPASGVYNVCLTIHDGHGCSHTICHHITVNTVHHPCQAAFTFHADPSGTLIYFTNTSTGTTNSTTFTWDFGDGNSSSLVNAHHNYLHTGHYTVCLFLHDPSTGCSSHYCHQITVFHTVSHHPDPHHPQDSIVNHHHSGGGDDHHHHGKGEDPHSGNGHHAHHPVLAPLFSANDFQNKLSSDGYILNYPNPFVNSTTIQYALLEDSEVSLEIIDSRGYKVGFQIAQNQKAGMKEQVFTAENLSPGVYFLKLNVGGQIFHHKIAVIR